MFKLFDDQQPYRKLNSKKTIGTKHVIDTKPAIGVKSVVNTKHAIDANSVVDAKSVTDVNNAADTQASKNAGDVQTASKSRVLKDLTQANEVNGVNEPNQANQANQANLANERAIADDMLLTMAQDVGIQRFIGESELSFTQRVLYSGLSCWLKTMTLNPQANPSESGLVPGRKVKALITRDLTQLLNEFLLRYPEAIPYFVKTSSKLGTSLFGGEISNAQPTSRLQPEAKLATQTASKLEGLPDVKNIQAPNAEASGSKRLDLLSTDPASLAEQRANKQSVNEQSADEQSAHCMAHEQGADEQDIDDQLAEEQSAEAELENRISSDLKTEISTIPEFELENQATLDLPVDHTTAWLLRSRLLRLKDIIAPDLLSLTLAASGTEKLTSRLTLLRGCLLKKDAFYSGVACLALEIPSNNPASNSQNLKSDVASGLSSNSDLDSTAKSNSDSMSNSDLDSTAPLKSDSQSNLDSDSAVSSISDSTANLNFDANSAVTPFDQALSRQGAGAESWNEQAEEQRNDAINWNFLTSRTGSWEQLFFAVKGGVFPEPEDWLESYLAHALWVDADKEHEQYPDVEAYAAYVRNLQPLESKESETPEWMEQVNNEGLQLKFFNTTLADRVRLERLWDSHYPRFDRGELPVVLCKTCEMLREQERYFLWHQPTGRFHVLSRPACQTQEYYRLMFALVCKAQHHVCADVQAFQDHVQVHLPSRLPELESRLLETLAWPVRSVRDLYCWQMSSEVWDFVRPYLQALGLQWRINERVS